MQNGRVPPLYVTCPSANRRARNAPEWIDTVLTQPRRAVLAAGGREERQGVFGRDRKRMLPRVIVEGDLIITAVLTSKLDKYGA